jgi:hypothetical protein
MNTTGHSNDAQVQPNYIPMHEREADYIKDYEQTSDDMIDNYNRNVNRSNSLDDMYNEIQLPLLLAVLYFFFQLPFFRKFLFSYFPMMWGYATWRRTINDHDDKMKNWPRIKKNFFSEFTNNKMFVKYWTKIFNDGYNKKFLAYDFQMMYSNLKNKKLSIIPKKNLVKNIGFVDGATHTKTKQWYSEMETHELRNIKHPKIITTDPNYDNWINVNVFQIKHYYFIQKIRKYMIFRSKIVFKISKTMYKIFYYIFYYNLKSFFLNKIIKFRVFH